jgi:hypothetical protein
VTLTATPSLTLSPSPTPKAPPEQPTAPPSSSRPAAPGALTPPSGNSKSNTGIIAGAVAAGLVAVAVAALVARLLVRRRSKRAAGAAQLKESAHAGEPSAPGAGENPALAAASEANAPVAPWHMGAMPKAGLPGAQLAGSSASPAGGADSSRKTLGASFTSGRASQASTLNRSLRSQSSHSPAPQRWALPPAPPADAGAAEAALAQLTTFRVAPATGATHHMATSILNSTGWSHVTVNERGSTLAQPDAKQRLVVALQNMTATQPPQLFAGRYVLIDERACGSQGLGATASTASSSTPSSAPPLDTYVHHACCKLQLPVCLQVRPFSGHTRAWASRL